MILDFSVFKINTKRRAINVTLVKVIVTFMALLSVLKINTKRKAINVTLVKVIVTKRGLPTGCHNTSAIAVKLLPVAILVSQIFKIFFFVF